MIPTATGVDWRPRAARLAEQLEAQGSLQDPAWKAAVSATPRHVFVPEAVEQDITTCEWHPVDLSSPEGLDLVYSPNTTLVTRLADRGDYQEAISSSTRPDLIVEMLEFLEIRDGNRTLAVGTGSGYTTALLCHRLGEERVFSVDIDQELVESARRCLADIGYRPTLAAVDGADGFPEHAPFDRIIATCSVPAVPHAWIDQLVVGGLVLVDIRPTLAAGNLALLRRDNDRLQGRFAPWPAAFMTMRHHTEPPAAARRERCTDTRYRTTTAPPNPWWGNGVVWMLAQFLGLPAGVRVGMELDPETQQPSTGIMTAPDGSWAATGIDPIDTNRWAITEAGPAALWRAVEQAQDLYEQHGRPGWERLGLTVTQTHQHVWIDDPATTIGVLR